MFNKSNKRGSGSVYQQPSSAIWWIQYYKDGRRIRESSHTVKRTEAVKLLNRRLADIAAGKPVLSDTSRTMFEDLTRIILDDYAAKERKIDITSYITHLREVFAGTRAQDITADRITSYIAYRKEQGSAPGTINLDLSVLKRAFKLAMIAGKVSSIPHVEMLPLHNARKGFFEPEQLQAVLRYLPEYLVPVAQVAYITGWRAKSELLTRQKKHLDMDSGWLRLDPGETKNGEGRMFPLTRGLRSILEAQLAHTRELERATGRIIPWLFHHDGEPIKSYERAWRTACIKAGCPGSLVHDFRRTAVRNLERAGVSRSAAMKMTGHLTEAIYRRYAIVDESMLRDGAVKLSELHDSIDAQSNRHTLAILPLEQRLSTYEKSK